MHAGQSADNNNSNSSVCFGDGGLVAGAGGGFAGQRKGQLEMGQPKGGGGDTGARETWMHQSLLGGAHTERKNSGDPDTAAVGSGACSSDESWVVREFKARVEAARRQEEELQVLPSGGAAMA